MGDVSALAEHVVYRVEPFIDREVASVHLRLEAAYRNGERDSITLSCMLAEIVALKNFKDKLVREAKKNERRD